MPHSTGKCSACWWRSGAVLLLLVSLPVKAATFSLSDPALSACINELAEKHGWQTQEQVLNIKCHNRGISALEGLQQFSRLQALSLFNNRIAQANIADLAQLKLINLARNRLSRLQLSRLPALEQLFLFDNQLRQLELTDLPQLKLFKGNGNGMRRFEYRDLPTLQKVYLFDNKLERMDIYQLPALEYMDVRENPMPDELYDEMDALEQATILHDGNADDW